MIGDNSDKYYALYNSELKKVEAKIKKVFNKREPSTLYKPAEYIMDGKGKRLRPLLVLFSAAAVGGKTASAYNASVAVELLHNFTLVHDDIMDNADKRRGKDTLHIKYDENTAILAGDSLLAVAYETLLKDCGIDCKNVVSDFTKGLVEVCEGQSLDKDFETRKTVTIEDYLEMIGKKTAAMLEMCCTIGGRLGEGTEKEVRALGRFGKNIGIAFQIQDDLLDITGNEYEFGKFVGGDLVEGKKTFLFIKALRKAKGADRKMLLEVIRKKGIARSEIAKYKKLYYKLGIPGEAEAEIKAYTKKAHNALKTLNNGKAREVLGWIADSLIKRSK